MRKLFILILSFITTITHSQNVGIGTTAPDLSAALDVTSTSQGFLPPRMTFSQIMAIPSPAPGLIIYNTTFNKPVYFDSLNWRYFNDSLMRLYIGQHLFGGIIFYIDPTGKHGLVAAETDQSTSATWWNGSNVFTGAFSSSEGGINTTAIINFQGNTGTYAAKICKDYRGGGFSDWFLPARDQLNLLYAQKSVTGMSDYVYWSSTEFDLTKAYDLYFQDGSQLTTVKSFLDYVRAVRAF